MVRHARDGSARTENAPPMTPVHEASSIRSPTPCPSYSATHVTPVHSPRKAPLLFGQASRSGPAAVVLPVFCSLSPLARALMQQRVVNLSPVFLSPGVGSPPHAPEREPRAPVTRFCSPGPGCPARGCSLIAFLPDPKPAFPPAPSAGVSFTFVRPSPVHCGRSDCSSRPPYHIVRFAPFWVPLSVPPRLAFFPQRPAGAALRTPPCFPVHRVSHACVGSLANHALGPVGTSRALRFPPCCLPHCLNSVVAHPVAKLFRGLNTHRLLPPLSRFVLRTLTICQKPHDLGAERFSLLFPFPFSSFLFLSLSLHLFSLRCDSFNIHYSTRDAGFFKKPAPRQRCLVSKKTFAHTNPRQKFKKCTTASPEKVRQPGAGVRDRTRCSKHIMAFAMSRPGVRNRGTRECE